MKKINTINLCLAVLALTSYAATMYLLSNLTYAEVREGEIGGVLEYRAFGISKLFHITKEYAVGETLLTFPDITAYLLTAFIIINAVALINQTTNNNDELEGQSLGSIILRIGLATGALLGHIWLTTYISNFSGPDGPGVIVNYQYPFPGFLLSHVHEGHPTSARNSGNILDFPVLLILTLIVKTITQMIKKHNKATATQQNQTTQP